MSLNVKQTTRDPSKRFRGYVNRVQSRVYVWLKMTYNFFDGLFNIGYYNCCANVGVLENFKSQRWGPATKKVWEPLMHVMYYTLLLPVNYRVYRCETKYSKDIILCLKYTTTHLRAYIILKIVWVYTLGNPLKRGEVLDGSHPIPWEVWSPVSFVANCHLCKSCSDFRSDNTCLACMQVATGLSQYNCTLECFEDSFGSVRWLVMHSCIP